jgi:nicotinate-nucleotide adenylyltransferase
LTATSATAAASTRRRIGLFGGSFDPVHQAHLALARAALVQLQLDELRWMPVGQPWHKARVLQPAEHRAAMVRLVIGDEPRFVLELCEIERAGPSYTFDSLVALQTGALAADRADWFLVIGQDQYASFTAWHGWQAIMRRATLAVAQRAGAAARPPDDLAAWLAAALAQGDIEPRRQPVHIDLPAHDHAATALRVRLASGADPATLAPVWLAPEVAGYIARHRLYQGGIEAGAGDNDGSPDNPLPPPAPVRA